MGTRYQSLPRSINFSSTTLLSVPRLNSTGGEINFNTSSFDDARTVREYYYYQLGRAAMLFPKFPRRRQSHPPPSCDFPPLFHFNPERRKGNCRWDGRVDENISSMGGKVAIKRLGFNLSLVERRVQLGRLGQIVRVIRPTKLSLYGAQLCCEKGGERRFDRKVRNLTI